MVRILSGGGQSPTGHPTTKNIGRPGFGSVARGFRQSVRRLMISDPADAVLTTPISDVPLIGGVGASLTTNLAGANNDLVFTAGQAGTGGNAVTIAYVNPGTANAALGVTVAGNAITVNLATTAVAGTIASTAAQVKAAVNAHSAASALVTAALADNNDGTGVVTALTATNLAGGVQPEVRQKLPPGLAKRPSSPTISGKEESVPTWKSLPLGRTATVRVRTRNVNRGLRKR